MRVLVVSSWVAHGHVGLCAAVPALQALGVSVSQIPTTVLSNHPGWPHVTGAPQPPESIAAFADALAANGWLARVDAVLTGYLPSPDHVAGAAALIDRLRALAPGARVVVDPVLGDWPKGLYLPAETATALRGALPGRADVLTPNRLELAWLTGMACETAAETTAAARALCDASGAGAVVVTGAPAPPGHIATLRVTDHCSQSWVHPRRDGVPHGTGDVFAALVAGGCGVGQALGHLTTLIDASLGADHLRIAETAAQWRAAAALDPVTPQRDD